MAEQTSKENLHLKEELALYEAPARVLRQIADVALWGFVGPSGSGKDTLMDWLVAHRPDLFARVVGDATRKKQKNDIEGLTHHFRTKQEMIDDLHNRRFVQVAPGSVGNFYATRPKQYPKSVIAMKAIYAREMANFRRLGFKKVKWLQIVPYSDGAWQEWGGVRQQNSQDQLERNQEAIESYKLALMNPDTYFVLNDNIEEAGQRIVRIAQGRLLPNAVEAKQIAVHNLDALKSRVKIT